MDNLTLDVVDVLMILADVVFHFIESIHHPTGSNPRTNNTTQTHILSIYFCCFLVSRSISALATARMKSTTLSEFKVNQ